MKFAKDPVLGTKIMATLKAFGLCPYCDKAMVAKCGNIKLHHWAHKSLRNCDHWWENETEWHRQWKDLFPLEWQEVVKRDVSSGEKHMADVFNPYLNLVVEFQNSPIKGEEIRAREEFYSRMIWLLNGARLKFLTIPVGELNHDFAKLEARVKARYLRSYREEKLKVEIEISHLRDKAEALSDQQTHRKITDIEWVQKSRRLDKEIENLQDSLVSRRTEVEAAAKEELTFDKYLIENSKRKLENRFIVYDWKYKNPSLDAATKPIFVDHQGELFLLKSKYIAVAVPVSSFLEKYRAALSK